MNHIAFWVVIYRINKCTTKWLFFSLFSSLLKKREGENENQLEKPVLNKFFNDPFDNHRFVICKLVYPKELKISIAHRSSHGFDPHQDINGRVDSELVKSKRRERERQRERERERERGGV